MDVVAGNLFSAPLEIAAKAFISSSLPFWR